LSGKAMPGGRHHRPHILPCIAEKSLTRYVLMNTFGKVGQVILPQQHGARKWAAEHGNSLVCVRYCYDPVACVRHTTVEITVESAPWQPPLPDTVLIHVAFEEESLRHQLRARGATWEAAMRRWRVPTSVIEELNLKNRIDSQPGSR
jgi:hypothetical protein